MAEEPQPVRLSSNEFWGKRSGSVNAKYGAHFPGRRGSQLAHQEHSGNAGARKKRFHQPPRRPYSV